MVKVHISTCDDCGDVAEFIRRVPYEGYNVYCPRCAAQSGGCEPLELTEVEIAE